MTHQLDTEKLAREAGIAEFGGCTEANLQKLVRLVLEEAEKLQGYSLDKKAPGMFKNGNGQYIRVADIRALAEGGAVMSARPGYCPIGGEPCQSMCDTPCGKPKKLTHEQIDKIINDGGYRNAVGGIYATSIYRFAADIQRAAALMGDAP